MPGVAIVGLRTLREQIEGSTARPRAVARITGIFSVVALVLASLGLYGVIAFDLALRRKEIAIRVALGATPRRIVASILNEVLLLVAVGGGISLAVIAGAAPTVRQFLYGVSPLDPVTMMVSFGAFTAAGLMAALPLALRAARPARVP